MRKGIIITSFGTTYIDTRKLCIDPIECRIRDIFNEDLVISAFTSRVIISKIKERYDYIVDNPTDALEKMKASDINNIYIQPLLIIGGYEYEKVKQEVNHFLKTNNDFNVKIGKALLTDDTDYERVVNELNLKKHNEGFGTIFMGHGTGHISDYAYNSLEYTMESKGYKNIFIGTLEGEKTIEQVVSKLIEKNINNVDLKPFMLVAGRHVRDDMASNRENSWKSLLERHNIEVNIEINGIGGIIGIQNMFIDKLRDTMK